MQSHAKPCKAMQSHAKPCKAMQSHAKLQSLANQYLLQSRPHQGTPPCSPSLESGAKQSLWRHRVESPTSLGTSLRRQSTAATKRAYGDPVFPSRELWALLCAVDRDERCAINLFIFPLGSSRSRAFRKDADLSTRTPHPSDARSHSAFQPLQISLISWGEIAFCRPRAETIPHRQRSPTTIVPA
jgi:hypothetical protein